MSFWHGHEKRALMSRLAPAFHATARRWVPQLEEFAVVDLAPGRELVIPTGPPRPCAHCWGNRAIFEAGILGLVPLLCDRCFGSGYDPT